MKKIDVGIVGLGTAGGAAALFLARAGHRVTIYERVPEPGPVGAGIVLQPTGMSVLARLALFDEVYARGARIDRLHAKNAAGRTVVDLAYARMGPSLFGLGLHRGVLFDALYRAVRAEPQISLRLGSDIARFSEQHDRVVVEDHAGGVHGPHDLLVIADGAQSKLRAETGLEKKVSKYPWGALWYVARDPNGDYREVLRQVVDGPSRLYGLLPTGLGPGDNTTPLVSIFWSMRHDRVETFRARGFDAWREECARYDPRSKILLDQISSAERVLYSSYFDVVLKRPNLGRVICLGDAAHAMSPQLGQGCNLALVDAMTLADCISVQEDIPRALALYAARRGPQIAYYQFATRWLTPLFQSDYAVFGLFRDLTMGLMCKIPPLEAIMLRSMAGVKRGILRRSSPLPQSPQAIG